MSESRFLIQVRLKDATGYNPIMVSSRWSVHDIIEEINRCCFYSSVQLSEFIADTVLLLESSGKVVNSTASMKPNVSIIYSPCMAMKVLMEENIIILKNMNSSNSHNPHLKRKNRSVSGRFRTVSSLVEDGLITSNEKSELNRLIISGDKHVEERLDNVICSKEKDQVSGVLRGSKHMRPRGVSNALNTDGSDPRLPIEDLSTTLADLDVSLDLPLPLTIYTLDGNKSQTSFLEKKQFSLSQPDAEPDNKVEEGKSLLSLSPTTPSPMKNSISIPILNLDEVSNFTPELYFNEIQAETSPPAPEPMFKLQDDSQCTREFESLKNGTASTSLFSDSSVFSGIVNNSSADQKHLILCNHTSNCCTRLPPSSGDPFRKERRATRPTLNLTLKEDNSKRDDRPAINLESSLQPYKEDQLWYSSILSHLHVLKYDVHEDYEMIEEIGSGVTSTVYHAISRTGGDRVAIKRIYKNRVMDPKFLVRELDISYGLRHSNILGIDSIFESKDDLFLVMGLCGMDLFSYIEDKGPLNEPDAKFVTRSLLNAIAYLHDKSIVHRDIKPENILIQRNSTLIRDATIRSSVVKLCDFGIARRLGYQLETIEQFNWSGMLPTTRSRSARAHTKCGTRDYVAPEVIRNSKHGYGSKVDIFSIGIVVYVLLTASAPTFKIRNGEKTVSVEQEFNQISKEAKEFIILLTQSHPEKRPTAVDALQHMWLKNR